MALIACSFGTTALHHHVYDAVRHGPATLAEFALAVLTLILAGTGVLMVIHGAALFARRKHDALPSRPIARVADDARIEPAVFDSRYAVADLLARRAMAAADRARATRAGHRR